MPENGWQRFSKRALDYALFKSTWSRTAPAFKRTNKIPPVYFS